MTGAGRDLCPSCRSGRDHSSGPLPASRGTRSSEGVRPSICAREADDQGKLDGRERLARRPPESSCRAPPLATGVLFVDAASGCSNAPAEPTEPLPRRAPGGSASALRGQPHSCRARLSYDFRWACRAYGQGPEVREERASWPGAGTDHHQVTGSADGRASYGESGV